MQRRSTGKKVCNMECGNEHLADDLRGNRLHKQLILRDRGSGEFDVRTGEPSPEELSPEV
jgi:hypothetical protein